MKVDRNSPLEQRKQAVLDAAIGLAETKGWARVSLRKVSAEVGYSTIIVYQLFGSKEGLYGALSEHGFFLFLTQLRAVLAQKLPPTQTVVAFSDAAWDFSILQRAYYEVMFGLAGEPLNCSGQTSAGTECSVSSFAGQTAEIVQSFLVQCIAGDARELFANWWALVHGFIMIHRSVGEAEKPQVNPLFQAAIKRFLNIT